MSSSQKILPRGSSVKASIPAARAASSSSSPSSPAAAASKSKRPAPIYNSPRISSPSTSPPSSPVAVPQIAITHASPSSSRKPQQKQQQQASARPVVTPRSTSIYSTATTATTGTTATSGSGGSRKFRYSGDLELQLGFEKNPLDKPSSEFRNADSWFKTVKEGTESAGGGVAKSGSRRGSPAPRSPAPRSPRGIPGKQQSTASGGAGSFLSPLSRPQHQNIDVDESDDAKEEYDDFGDSAQPYLAPQSQQNQNQKATVGRTNSFLRSSFQMIRNSFLPAARRTAADFEGEDATPQRKRPHGPRRMGEPSAYGWGASAESSTTLGRSASSIPMPPVIQQPRFFVYIAILLLSGACLVFMALSIVQLHSNSGTPAAGAAATGTRRPTPTTVYVVITAGLSFILAATCLTLYAWLGRHLLNYYDAPFLFCQDLPSSIDSHQDYHSGYDSGGGDEFDEDGRSTRKRGYTNLDTLRKHVAAPLQHRPFPSRTVPLADLVVHAGMAALWVAALVDLGLRTGGAARVLGAVCPHETATTAAAAASAPEFCGWRGWGALAFGAAAAAGVVAALVAKCIELWRHGVVRSVLKRRVVMEGGNGSSNGNRY
ncbi:hypothetical protein DFJ73DRAFT_774928 [Zopfochytrium polystomum]|nr:hypothetical protein DFJ73DRAFT_774928 [Zopfochytrium polystomum]